MVKLKASDYTRAAIRKRLDEEVKAPPCKNAKAHTPSPDGYVAWHEWAARMLKTHRQTKCRGCGLYKVWVKKTSRSSGGKSSPNRSGDGAPSVKGGSLPAEKTELNGSVKRADAALARRSPLLED